MESTNPYFYNSLRFKQEGKLVSVGNTWIIFIRSLPNKEPGGALNFPVIGNCSLYHDQSFNIWHPEKQIADLPAYHQHGIRHYLGSALSSVTSHALCRSSICRYWSLKQSDFGIHWASVLPAQASCSRRLCLRQVYAR